VPLAGVSVALVAVALLAAFFFGVAEEEAASRPTPLRSRLGLAAQAALVALGSDESEFETARSELLAVLEERKDRLPANAHTTVTENLEIIDNEIAAISAELSRDPKNRRLARILAEAYQRELELLQRAAALPLVAGANDS
jgi:hypothetical protein